MTSGIAIGSIIGVRIEHILVNYQINEEINLLLIVPLISNESIFPTK